MKNSCICILAFLTILAGQCKKEAPDPATGSSGAYEEKDLFNIGFYNVENLFDTIPDINDTEFTPDGVKRWTGKRYLKKLDDLSMVISSMKNGNIHALGLSEIENVSVLNDLVNTDRLKAFNFSIVHFDSPGSRGVDVGLIYQANKYSLYLKHSMHIDFPEQPNHKTRDVLRVSGTIRGSDTLHTYVAHFTSRRGGAGTEYARMHIAKVIKADIDSIMQHQPTALICLMGDFNDEPFDKSMLWILKGQRIKETLNQGDLYNLAYAASYQSLGTYCYRDKWQMLDQILINTNLVNGLASWQYLDGSFEIMSPDWMRQGPEAGRYEGYPNRTYAGNRYLGGQSDHFPVLMTLIKKK